MSAEMADAAPGIRPESTPFEPRPVREPEPRPRETSETTEEVQAPPPEEGAAPEREEAPRESAAAAASREPQPRAQGRDENRGVNIDIVA